MQEFPTQETTFIFAGPVGDIEVLATPHAEGKSAPATAIICHPHPLHGGALRNKVVTTLARAFRDLGLKTVRFNFRGVGKTFGTYDEGRGESDDLLAISKWVKTCFPQDEIWLAGFSFGGFVAANTAAKVPAAQLITVAPPVGRFNMHNLPLVPCPWLIIQGEKDDVVQPERVFEWAEMLSPQPTLIKIPEAGHFFHGQLLELRQHVENSLLSSVPVVQP